MPNHRPRSAGVTAAATFAILGCVSALFIWAYFFLALLNAPPDPQGKHFYQMHPVAILLIATIPPALIAAGIRTAIGLYRLRFWARFAALIWASVALILCLGMIAFRPFETFIIPHYFVSELESFKQLLAIAFVFMLFPVSVWWLFLFRTKSVKMQFLRVESENPAQEPSAAGKT